MKFLRALFWESLQNLPLLGGFLVGARMMQNGRVGLALVCALVGILLGVLVMHFTETRLHPDTYTSTLKGVVVNALVFFVLAVPFLFYYGGQARWIGWRSDIVLGVVIGLVMTAGQGLGWEGDRRRLIQHAAAMAAACPLIMLAIRYALRIPTWGTMLGSCLLFTVAISAVIVLIDYWPQLKRQRDAG